MSKSRLSATVKRFYGSSAIVQLAEGIEAHAETSHKNKLLVCGDQVFLERRTDGYFILQTEPRRTEFFRTDGFGRRKVIAANIDQIFLVLAIEPTPHMQVIDRYWVAARNCHIPMHLVLNKSDLPANEPVAEIDRLYGGLGMSIYSCSAKTGEGMAELSAALHGNTAVLVGPSGVGKSSLINTLCDSADAQVGRLSERRDEGRHTTTTSDFYHLDEDTRVIDSPGIREFGLQHYDQSSLESGFVEIANLAAECRFRDCVHLNTPGCAVKAAADQGKIDMRRLESYYHLLKDKA